MNNQDIAAVAGNRYRKRISPVANHARLTGAGTVHFHLKKFFHV